MGLNRHAAPVYVHVEECWNAGKRSRGISRDQARRAKLVAQVNKDL
ncbi:DUF6233 domain-containing protein [Streptomyces sp. GESEQ-35]|nr:DUF6233 domain-containing protein [Streptomyces sp. GESEQ-35]